MRRRVASRNSSGGLPGTGTAGVVIILKPGSVVRVHICFDVNLTIRIVTIIIIEEPVIIIEPPVTGEPPEGGKVTVCHKPGKKGGHTLSISQSALPAHLGHGDYVGACR